MFNRKKKSSLGYVGGYGRSRGSGYGYVSKKGHMRMSSRRRKMPSFVPVLLGVVGVTLFLALLVGGTTWWNYSRFTNATHEQDATRVAQTYQSGTKSRIPGSSQLFWWLATKHVSTEMGVAANEGIGNEAVEQFAKTYRDTPDLINEIIIPKAKSAVEQYKEMFLEEPIAAAYLDIGLQLRPENADLVEGKKTFDILVDSRAAFAAAKKAAEQPYGAEEAADLFELVAEIDEENYAIAQKEIPELRLRANEEMQTWAAPVKHFTLNPLLAFPYMTPLDYANDYITAVEFKRILQQLYDNGFILVGLETLFTYDVDTGIVEPVPLRIPKDKMPIVLSIENLTYSTRHEKRGMVDRLIVSNDKVATFTSAANAGTDNDVISFDNDVIPILNAFIEENPVFSWKGARATISLTGYRGNLGYRTSFGFENQMEEIAKAKEVAGVLHENGYTFASLGFEYVEMSSLEVDQIIADAQLWVDQTSNIVGLTNLFFWPFGDALAQDSEGAEALRAFGYRSFSQIGPNSYEAFTGVSRVDERAFIDGNGLNNRPERYAGYFDATTVLDAEGRAQIDYWLTW